MRGDNFLIQKQFIFTVTGQAGRWPLSPSPTEVRLNSQALKTRVLHPDKFGHSLDFASTSPRWAIWCVPEEGRHILTIVLISRANKNGGRVFENIIF
jgi:hypothetical protein